MSIKQKIKKAVELVELEEDGSTYLQTICTLKELNQALASTNRRAVKEIIQDAIAIRKFNNRGTK